MLNIVLTTLIGASLFGPPDEATWKFAATSSGENFVWNSPSSITPDGSFYEMNYQVNEATVMVSYIGIDFGPISVLDMFPEDIINTWRASEGPAPLDFGWIEVVAPDDQDPPAIAFDWIVEIDEKGQVEFRMENVFAGQAEYNLGWPWGTVTVNVESGTLYADLWVAKVPTPCYADVNGDNLVNVTDLLAVISDWGYCYECVSDTNYDSYVDVTDLLYIINAWGPCGK